MTDSPPPHGPPAAMPPPRPPEPRTPGFLLCGVAVFVGYFVLGGVVVALSGLVNAAWFRAAVVLSALAALIMLSIRDPRFGKCLVKGIVANVAVFAVLAGACLALLASSGI